MYLCICSSAFCLGDQFIGLACSALTVAGSFLWTTQAPQAFNPGFQTTGTSKMPKLMASYPKIESMGSIGSIILGLAARLGKKETCKSSGLGFRADPALEGAPPYL